MSRSGLHVVLAIIVAIAVGSACLAMLHQRSNRPMEQPHRMTARPAVIPKTSTPPVTSEFSVPVLMYHRIDNLTKSQSRSRSLRDLTVSPANFHAQIDYLLSNGYTFLTADAVAEAVRKGGPLPQKAVAVTFDDGYRDAYEWAYPVLRRHNLAATVFVVTGRIGDARHISWANMKEMQSHGIAFGSHTIHHFDLTRIPYDLLEHELHDSAEALQRRLHLHQCALAYPNGCCDGTVVSSLSEDGYTAGWRKSGGPVTPGSDIYALPRIRVSGFTTLKQFKTLIRPHAPEQ